MVTEGEPSDFVKVLHLLVLAFSWGMQLWVTFIAGEWGTKQRVVTAAFCMHSCFSTVFDICACRFCVDSTGNPAHLRPGAE